MNRFKQWLQKGDGGEWYEPYITGEDVLSIVLLTITASIVLVTLIVVPS